MESVSRERAWELGLRVMEHRRHASRSMLWSLNRELAIMSARQDRVFTKAQSLSGRIKTPPQSDSCPRREFNCFSRLLAELRGERETLKRIEAELAEAAKTKQSLVSELCRHEQGAGKAGEKLEGLRAEREIQKSTDEQEMIDELAALRGFCSVQGAESTRESVLAVRQESAVRGASSAAAEMGMAGEVSIRAGGQRAAEGRHSAVVLPDDVRERVKDCSIWQGQSSSGVSLTVDSTKGGELALDLSLDKRRELSIRIAADTERDRRRLWSEKSRIVEALKESGMVVRDFVLTRNREHK